MPVATALAGVNMRLEPGAIRELHWHNTAETEGDIWYFPAGNPHSLQAKNTTKSGAEFLLIFDSGKLLTLYSFEEGIDGLLGSFSEDSTFLLPDWLAHVPKGNFANSLASPPPEDVASDMVVPNNTPNPYTFELSKVAGTKKPGGSIKVVDSRTFKVALAISAVEVTVEVGGMRELHWHPTEPEWSFFISGQARVTVFAASLKARTFDFIHN
ncbi:RmlC-like cupin domain-containing protein [Mycena capillaripes]|nr:RmlC-like cupin domain-containing protein [Mycena capillaripes]